MNFLNILIVHLVFHFDTLIYLYNFCFIKKYIPT